MAEPGWYEDPAGGGGQRWWDGVRWSEHTIPPPPAAVAVPSGPVVPPPGAVPPPPGAVLPPPPPGAPGVSAPPATVGEVVTASAPATPMVARPPSRTRSGPPIRLPLIALAAAVLLVAVGALVVTLWGSEDGPPDVRVAAGDQRDLVVPEDGRAELVIVVPEGLLVVDVRGLGGFDPIAELLDERGQQLDRNDDRSMEQLERYGGGVFDSLIEQQVPAGTYRVVVTGFAGSGGEAEVGFPVVGG